MLTRHVECIVDMPVKVIHDNRGPDYIDVNVVHNNYNIVIVDGHTCNKSC